MVLWLERYGLFGGYANPGRLSTRDYRTGLHARITSGATAVIFTYQHTVVASCIRSVFWSLARACRGIGRRCWSRGNQWQGGIIFGLLIKRAQSKCNEESHYKNQYREGLRIPRYFIPFNAHLFIVILLFSFKIKCSAWWTTWEPGLWLSNRWVI